MRRLQISLSSRRRLPVGAAIVTAAVVAVAGIDGGLKGSGVESGAVASRAMITDVELGREMARSGEPERQTRRHQRRRSSQERASSRVHCQPCLDALAIRFAGPGAGMFTTG